MPRPTQRNTDCPSVSTTSSGSNKRGRSKSRGSKNPAIPKRQRNHRTAKDPWEASVVDGPEHEVDKILGSSYKKGLKVYTVLWKEGDTTEEPQENLVGASEMVREFNEARAASDREAKVKLADLRRLRKAEKLAAETEAAAAATAAALASAMKSVDDGNNEGHSTSQPMPDDVVAQPKTGRLVLRMHRNKTGTVWKVFDLLQEKPSCLVELSPGVKCGCVPSTTGGTSNYWQHLYHHHRAKWLELKNEDGVLTPAGLHQIEQVRDAMAARMAASVNCTKKPSLPAHARVTLDRLTAEWIVDEDQYTNAAAKPGFQKLFNAATDGAYEGCCSKTVQGHVAKLAVEGRAKTSLLHSLVLEAGFRIVVSADLWSKNGVALLGILSHAIVELVDDNLCG